MKEFKTAEFDKLEDAKSFAVKVHGLVTGPFWGFDGPEGYLVQYFE